MPPSSWPTHPDIAPWWSEDGRASLTRRAKLVSNFDAQFRRRAQRLRETMLRTPNAVGLAANQVGWRAAVFVAELREDAPPVICVNPRLEDIDQAMLVRSEACLSIPGFHGGVARPRSATLVAFDEKGVLHRYALTGFPARIAFHEFDHLLGLTYLKRLHRPLVARDSDNVEFLLGQDLALPEEAFLRPGGAPAEPAPPAGPD